MMQNPETLAIRGGVRGDRASGALLTPIVQSTTYRQSGIGTDQRHTYSRVSNPTVESLETALAAFEGLSHAICFSTGMAATSALALALLRAGDHVVCGDVVYGGTVRLFAELLSRLGIEASFVDASKPADVDRAIRRCTRLVFVETPANPTLRLCDIEALASITRRAGVPLAVDNTFLTGALQRPGDLGADVVMYSTTKYVEGHNATVGGALLLDDEELADRLRWVRKTLGSIQSPHEAWLTLQGLKTLPLRMREHSAGALIVARHLLQHPAVTRVTYPWLDEFPQADLARRQQLAGGGIVTFEVRGDAPAARRFARALRCVTVAENLGAVESLATHPATMTHGDMSAEERRRVGIGDGLIRLSVGLEHPDDLIEDLDGALEAAVARAGRPREGVA